MDDARAAELVVALAALAGREVGAAESRTVVELAREMDAQRANEIWTRHRRAPDTLPLRDYLAMTLRFVERYSR
ncbi:MAG: hypothetical protein M3235_11115 [Actinomycetota bacterium]|nr:hypothetical protein [Actinomycetota bacterium]